VKIAVARQADRSREIKVLRSLSNSKSERAHSHNVVSMLHNFQLRGPNGLHECIVLELLGPSIRDLLDVRFGGERLPGRAAKSVAKQTLLGLDYLHKRKIGHGGMCNKYPDLISVSYSMQTCILAISALLYPACKP
jgi:serine/threonine-protein kinase SRPK3